jgi:hypothetical protein
MGAAGCLYRINRLPEVRREVGEGARLEEVNQNRSRICRSTNDNGFRTRNLGIPSVWSGVTNELLAHTTTRPGVLMIGKLGVSRKIYQRIGWRQAEVA